MTAIDPITGGAITTTGTRTVQPTDQFGKDTFLKLLVAQLKYQNPLSPVDGTQFLAQTAQFSMVEKLNELATVAKSNAAANEVIEAAAMINRTVSVATQNGTPAVSTVGHLGGNLSADAALGTKVSGTGSIYTSKGTQVPVKFEFTKLADSSDGSKHWEGRAYVGTTQIAGPFNVDFDSHGERTSPDPQLTVAELNVVPGTTGNWDPSGLRLDLGTSTDANRLRVANGSSSFTMFGQNGTDGQSINGVVTGVRFTVDGPLLSIGGQEYALQDVTEVHVSS